MKVIQNLDRTNTRRDSMDYQMYKKLKKYIRL